ncbi:MAG: hypothetical protein HY645_05200 [Acidobacteria bacterium]|nr:hypothetical protein [Acidobacteriota bacterium]
MTHRTDFSFSGDEWSGRHRIIHMRGRRTMTGFTGKTLVIADNLLFVLDLMTITTQSGSRESDRLFRLGCDRELPM